MISNQRPLVALLPPPNALREVWAYSFTTGLWRRLTSGAPWSGRCGHASATTSTDVVLVLGGSAQAEVLTADTFAHEHVKSLGRVLNS